MINRKKNIKRTVSKNFFTDILIIGGGITGLTCAYFLKDYDVTLIERDYVGCGATSNSTGKINYLQELLINKNKYIEDLYLKSQIEACKIVETIVKENNLNCNYENNSSYIYATEEKDIKKINKIEKILKRNNIKYQININNFMKNNIYSIKVDDTAVFNPYLYLTSLKEILDNKIKIYENSNATNYIFKDDKIIVQVNNIEITCNKLIVATGYPFKIKAGFIPFKTSVYKSFISASKIDENKKFNSISYDNIESFRFYTENQKDYLISSFDYSKIGNYDNKKNYNNLISKLKENYNSTPIYFWSNCDITSSDGIPLSGLLSDNVYIACAYSSWGMTNASISAKIISDNIKGIENEYSKLFNPKRFSNLPKLIEDNFVNAKSFISSKFNKLDKNEVKIFEKNGIRYGYFFDGEKTHVVKNICPHMKCNLTFNLVNKTWECPCHSSIFDIDGNIVKGPSNYSIKVEK